VILFLDYIHYRILIFEDEHGQGKWEGTQKGKSDKRIRESKARQKESTAL
jgi:hypothetical protein